MLNLLFGDLNGATIYGPGIGNASTHFPKLSQLTSETIKTMRKATASPPDTVEKLAVRGITHETLRISAAGGIYFHRVWLLNRWRRSPKDVRWRSGAEPGGTGGTPHSNEPQTQRQSVPPGQGSGSCSKVDG
ncbi:hypothetical protein LIPSTDRAFT_242981 [Lipomyces starkeyi NRRL Y-11557]|uniref:Uncharacterized protein n=1 Tax=Lipomyces starkeyi NRRL Y-11557 TaxID=675824 RepID=A0A1E3QC97_LIPST|nr:hypothetical protein LIPSTDRAFT_242981 [Lipomyces starkeyi NRRL Y-11557]